MKVKFRISGMTCAACSARVEKVSGQVPGVHKVEVNLLSGTMTAEADNKNIALEIISVVENAGYGASLVGERIETPKQSTPNAPKMKWRIIASFAFLAVLMYFTMGHMVKLPVPDWYQGSENAVVAALLQFFLTLPVVLINHSYYKKGLKALWNKAPNMDSLIAVGSGASLIYGVISLFCIAYASGHGDMNSVALYSKNLYFESAAMILTLITLGKFLEDRAKGKTGDAIRKLMDLSPKSAVVYVDGTEKEVPIEDIQVGDIVRVRSGGSIPVDGTILSGRAAIDQSALTGESVPVEKSQGDLVSAGTINTEGFLEIRTDKIGQDTTLSQVIRLVEEAGGSKAPIARLADKVAGIFVPIVMAISAAVFITWMLTGQSVSFSLNCAIAVLVISCPCALGLATPVAIMVGTGRGAEMGILFKNAQTLENLHHVNTVVLDKTGTITLGKPVATDVIPEDVDEARLILIAASLESKSEHPFAKAILAKAENITLLDVSEFETLPGRGVCGAIEDVKYFGGNQLLMLEHGVSVPVFDHLAQQGKTVLYFASENKNYLGAVAVADICKEDSADAVAAMKNLGLEVIMVTGDNEITAQAIAKKAGIDRCIAEVLPGNKASIISQLRKAGKKVLMVGDGINDAPALATADIGMAIGSGTDIAIESAGVVLMDNSLNGVAGAIQLSRATITNIRQNLFWAFFYNCVGIPVAAGVLYPAFGILLSPMIGAAAMSLSSVFVVSNALRLRFFKARAIKVKSQAVAEEESKMQRTIFVEGMMCNHCKARVESVCKAVQGVMDAVVDLQNKQVTVTGDASFDAIKKAITDAGYEVKE